MENQEVYLEKETPANELKGFTKAFVKRSKDKREEDKDVSELLTFNREKKLIFGARVAQKLLKAGNIKKVYTSANPDDLTSRKINHYAKILGVDVITLNLDNAELAQKLGKPFNVSIVSVIKK